MFPALWAGNSRRLPCSARSCSPLLAGSSGQEVVVVGNIQPDQTVKGGTGWGAEFAKICNKPLLVFDQEQDGWYRWLNDAWVKVEEPVIEHTHFTATGTRFMEANGRKAISDLFARSFNR